MIREDDRTPEQHITHRWAVVARDRFMSGWGWAAGGASRCAWAVPLEPNGGTRALDDVLTWVRNRKEMRYVNVVNLDTYRPPRGTAHFHIYAVDPATHPAVSPDTREAIRQAWDDHILCGKVGALTP